MAHILIVDDDPDVLGTVWRALSRDGHDVTLAESTAQALERMTDHRPDLLLLDIMMPNQDGLSFCEQLRQTDQFSALPILFLSARWRTDDVVRGLDAGGDDYLTKPFELNELSARVRALLRRFPQGEETDGVVAVGDLRIDDRTFQASTSAATGIQLTSTEYKLLHHLMSAPNQAHSVRDLLDVVWEYPAGAGDPDLVRAHIRNLRAKLEPEDGHSTYIHTIHGVGYMVKE